MAVGTSGWTGRHRAEDDGIPSHYAVTSDSESPSRTPFQSVILLLLLSTTAKTTANEP